MTRRKKYFHRRPPRFEDDSLPGHTAQEPPRRPVVGTPPHPGSGITPARKSPVRRYRDHRPGSRFEYKAPKTPDDDARPSWVAGVTPQEWVYMAIIGFVALLLRLKEPLSSAIIGAEDPYLHMERTWNFLRGDPVKDYPLGWVVFLTPLTLFGESGFYYAVRFVPPILGVISVAGMFVLCRPFIGGYGALAAAAVLAVMPEHIVRTNLLFPTAVDLAILPFFLLKVLHLTDGDRQAAWWLAGMGVFLITIHPWVVGLAVVPLALFAAISLLIRSRTPAWAAGAMAGGVLGVFVVLHFLPVWRPSELLFERAIPTLVRVIQDPSAIMPLPQHVNYVTMLTVPVLLLAVAGLVVAAVRHDRFSIFTITWVLVLLPVTLIDWFDVWYIPHRTVVYMALGIAILCGIAVDAGMKWLRQIASSGTSLHRPVGIATVALVLLLTVPTAAATPPWYRLYTDDDYESWHEIAARDPSLVVTGSWQGRAGYAAITGDPASYNAAFFTDENTRTNVVRSNPGLVVLIEQYAWKNGVSSDPFQDWELVGQWGDVVAYAPP